jgi:uncharacterized protein (TIGR01777 family)
MASWTANPAPDERELNAVGLHVFRKTSRLEYAADDVYEWHARPGAFQRLTPPWDPVKVIRTDGSIEDGARAVLEVRLGPIPVTWVAEHRDNVPGRQFSDVQVEGPFARWEHSHRFEPIDDTASVLEDRIEYAMPAESLHAMVSRGLVESKLDRTFDFRHRVMHRDLALLAGLDLAGGERFLVTGATGLLGSTLTDVLSTGGYEARALGRKGSSSPPPLAASDSVTWDPRSGAIDPEALEGVDFVVHLAGESIASGRWTEERRRAIRDSRVRGTRLLAQAIAEMEQPPKAMICASATGWYGSRGAEELTESSATGDGFLADVCREWEAAADPARAAGIRVVNLRFGMILWPTGGALERMLGPFRAGVGGRVGDGSQYWSWVSLDDAVGAILHSAATDALEGPVNVVAPAALRNSEFTSVLGSVLQRPTVTPAPGFLLRLALGDMADELLLASARVVPRRLLESGFEFRDPDLEPALRHMLGRVEGE